MFNQYYNNQFYQPNQNYLYPGHNNYNPNQNLFPKKAKTLNQDDNIIDEAYIDKVKDEENKDIGFDLSLLKRDELNVNLIHFDLNISNKENYEYYNKFKVDVVGGYIAMDNLYMLIIYLEAIKNKNIPFIVLSSGFSGKDVIPICRKYPIIKEVIIFCGNYDKYKHYLTQYPGYVNKIFVDIRQVYNYIKYLGPKFKQGIEECKKSDHFHFSLEDIQMNKQLEQCPVISAYEYDNCYFLVHRAYAHFFGDMNDTKNFIFTKSYFNKIQEYINNSEIRNKSKLIDQFKSLVDKDNFAELSIRTYTGESGFCYIFNRTMRNFDKGLISLAYYMGPFLFAVNKYVKENPINFKFNRDMTLFRNIQCSIFDFYLYKMNLNHIICFPSITSTSIKKGEFTPTNFGQKINNNGIKAQDMIKITMIFNYKHKEKYISPGIIVLKNKGKDGQYISMHPLESEVILFPFTFARITYIKEVSKSEKIYEIYFDIINRSQYIEYTLQKYVEKRYKFSDLDQAINKKK